MPVLFCCSVELLPLPAAALAASQVAASVASPCMQTAPHRTLYLPRILPPNLLPRLPVPLHLLT